MDPKEVAEQVELAFAAHVRIQAFPLEHPGLKALWEVQSEREVS